MITSVFYRNRFLVKTFWFTDYDQNFGLIDVKDRNGNTLIYPTPHFPGVYFITNICIFAVEGEFFKEVKSSAIAKRCCKQFADLVGWFEVRNPTLISSFPLICWVALRLTQPTLIICDARLLCFLGGVLA
jgi:hypothetical protein